VVTAREVKDLRDRTGAGMMDCKKALQEADGDIDKAVEVLRTRGLAAVDKRAGRQAAEGVIHSYIHTGGRVGVLLEVNCETDFVARTEEFRSFVHEMALQIAAAAPLYVGRDDVPEDVLAGERAVLRAQAESEGKPPHIVERIVEGRLGKFYERVCLLEQPWVRDPDRRVQELVKETAAKVGENVVVRRFTRYAVGEVS